MEQALKEQTLSLFFMVGLAEDANNNKSEQTTENKPNFTITSFLFMVKKEVFDCVKCRAINDGKFIVLNNLTQTHPTINGSNLRIQAYI